MSCAFCQMFQTDTCDVATIAAVDIFNIYINSVR